MAGGQLLFKLAANRSVEVGSAASIERLLALFLDSYFLAAIFLYFILSLVWIWILGFVPISRAYPFFALNFILVAVAGWLVFAERLTLTNCLGLALIVLGIILTTWDS